MKKIAIRIDDEDLRGLKVLAALKDTTPSSLLRQSVKDILATESSRLQGILVQNPTKGQVDIFPQEAESIVRLSDTSDYFQKPDIRDDQDNPFVDI